jgi:hypothetical protein
MIITQYSGITGGKTILLEVYMSKRLMFISGIVVLGLAILSCSMPLSPAATTPTGEVSKTVVISETPVASPTSATTAAPTVEIPVAAAATTAPTLAPTQAPAATSNPLACNWAEFVADITYPDDTVVPAAGSFVKTWRLKNIGSCTWVSNYKVLFVSGDAMGGPGSVQLTNGAVQPGSTVDVSVNLKAPASGGTFQGNYKLQSSDGTTFGIGPGANNVFYVKIVVESQAEQSGGSDNPPVIEPSIPPLSRNLKLTNPYMTGTDVKSLQSRLLALGYSIVGSADGKFGPKTDKGVRAFQADNGLAVDGIVGKKTWTALWD